MPRRKLHIDLETYSDVDLVSSGLYNYVQSPNFQILLMAYGYTGEKVKCLDLTTEEDTILLHDLEPILFVGNVTKCAFNNKFEIACLSKYFGLSLTEQQEWRGQWECTMLKSMYCGYPGKLEKCGEAMDLEHDLRKKASGTILINYFSKPCKPTIANNNRTRNLPEHAPEKWQEFKNYNIQDVVAERAIDVLLEKYSLPEAEKQLYLCDQRINDIGVSVDVELVDNILEISGKNNKILIQRAKELTNLENPNSNKQLLEWLQDEGTGINNIKMETLNVLKQNVEGFKAEEIKEIIEIKSQLASTSIKKYKAVKKCISSDNRIRGLFQFYGANRTGRWAGRLLQVHNLPRNNLKNMGEAREFIKEKNIDALRIFFGKNFTSTFKNLIRTILVPKDPHDNLIIADFSAIEARVIAWLAKEQWRLDVFSTHGKIYEASASQMFKVPLEKIVKGNKEYELRAKGKVAELALGYGGSIGAMKKMGADKMGLSENEMRRIVELWRGNNTQIVKLWKILEHAAITCMRTGNTIKAEKVIFRREVDKEKKLDFLTIELPSKRKLYYVEPQIQKNDFGMDSISYMGINGISKKWQREFTYGGKLAENITQAIARDILAETMMRLESEYKIVMHVHDEIVIESDSIDPERELKTICTKMSKCPTWAEGLKLNAEGFVSKYYKKE